MRRAFAIGTILFALSASPALAGTVTGDFNGDGRGDLAMGVPFEDIGSTGDAGAVHVLYGASGGLRNSTLNQTFTQGSAGIPDVAEAADYFGWSLATGDFNADGYADLAVGAPYEDYEVYIGPPPPFITYTNMGVATVIYGSATGLNGSKPAVELSRNGVDYDNEDHFGWALAAGNFGNGSAADLAVGSPFDDTDGSNNGTVSIFYGHTGGIDGSPSAVFAQSDPDINGDPNDQENFGAALAAGNFGRSSHADLVVGVPNDTVETKQLAGSVNVLYGSSSGITTTGDQRWTQDSPGMAGAAEYPDHFGSALAVAEFGRSTRADLAVSAPCEAIGAVSCAGGVHVIFGTKTGLSATGDQFWSQNSAGVADKADQSDMFGLALTAANFGKSGRADLAVSSNETIGTEIWAGAVQVLYGADGGLTAAGSQLWSQATTGIDTAPTQYDYFGWALGSGNFGRTGQADLAIGIPGEAFDASTNAGAVEVIYGTSEGLRVQNDDFLQQDDLSTSDGPEQQDYLGRSLAPRPSNYGWYWFE
jgi:hypothetical protein